MLHKLAQIEEHAKDALSEFPQLAKEHLRMILALARYLRSESTTQDSSALLKDDGNASSGTVGKGV